MEIPLWVFDNSFILLKDGEVINAQERKIEFSDLSEFYEQGIVFPTREAAEIAYKELEKLKK